MKITSPLILSALLLASAIGVAQSNQTPTYALSLSTLSNHSGSIALQGATLSGNVYIFTSVASQLSNYDPTGIAKVSYWLDNTTMSGLPTHSESYMPYDFAGSLGDSPSSLANPWDTTKMGNGTHTVTQLVHESNGTWEVDAATFTINNSTTAIGQLITNPTSLSFGNGMVGTTNTLPITVSNTGKASLTIWQANVAGSGFSMSGLSIPLSLAAGQSGSFNASFAPQAAGSTAGTIALLSNAANSLTTVSVTGNGVAAPGQLAANPTNLSFGNSTLGTTSTLPIVLTNTGASNVSISQANLTGSGFSIAGMTLPFILAAGQSSSFSVNFAPQVAGTATGTISLLSNAANSPTNVSLAGSGTVATVAHSVDVSWTASTSSVVGYNVYRANQSGGPYAKINSATITSIVFTDPTVQAGQTYYYVATSVDAGGVESVYSNQTLAVIPSP